MSNYDAWKSTIRDEDRSIYTNAEAVDLEDKLKEALDHIAKLQAAVDVAIEYFDQRMDADCVDGVFVPNDEMRAMGEIEELLGQTPRR